MRRILARAGKQITDHPVESLCDSFFIFYSLWSVAWILVFFANLTFSALLIFFFFIPPASVLALGLKPPSMDRKTPLMEKAKHRENLVVLLFVAIAVLLALFLHRPDADDEWFIGMAVSLLSQSDQPIQSLPRYSDTTYGLPAYEPLKAIVSHITGLPLLYSYYLLIPALMSAVTVIVSYRLLRELVTDGWFFGLLFFFLVMLTWGDTHRTLANFGFVRLFQGKSVFVSAVVPAVIFYFLRLRNTTHTKYDVLLLICAVVAGTGFSRAGWAIGPLLVLALGVASMKIENRSQSLRTLLAMTLIATVIVVPFVYLFGFNLNPAQLVHTARGSVETTTNLEMLHFTIGEGFRGFFLLGCVAVSFLFVRNAELRYLYRNYLAIFFLLLLIPSASNFFAKTIHAFLSWRWMWVMPIPVLASVAIGGGAWKLRQMSNSLVAFCAFLVLAVIFAAADPRRVVSQENYTFIRWPAAKLDGDSIHLRPQNSTARIKDARLYLEGDKKGY